MSARIENLKETEITSTLSYLQCLEFKIKEWLEEDEQKLIKRGLDNIMDDTDEISLNLRKKNII